MTFGCMNEYGENFFISLARLLDMNVGREAILDMQREGYSERWEAVRLGPFSITLLASLLPARTEGSFQCAIVAVESGHMERSVQRT